MLLREKVIGRMKVRLAHPDTKLGDLMVVSFKWQRGRKLGTALNHIILIMTFIFLLFCISKPCLFDQVCSTVYVLAFFDIGIKFCSVSLSTLLNSIFSVCVCKSI